MLDNLYPGICCNQLCSDILLYDTGPHMSANSHLFHMPQGRDFLFYRQGRAELFLTCAFWAMPGYTDFLLCLL